MENNTTVQKMQDLIALLYKEANAYYQGNEPIVSDKEYDKQYDELTALEQESGIILANSPTQRVMGEPAPELIRVRHTKPMLSCEKSKNIEDVRAFIQKAPLSSSENPVYVGWKLDGLTVVARYRDGSLSQLVTRGNGEDGEDVTHNARLFKNLPLNIPYQGTLEIRGEALVKHEEFEAINNELQEPFSLERSFASGMLRRLDNNQYASCLSLIVFELVEPQPKELKESMDFLTKQGFEVVPRLPVNASNLDVAVKRFIPEQYCFPVDGLVFEYNDSDFGRSLGSTGHHERSRFALKWADESVKTRLVDVIRNTTRSGMVSLKARFEPVIIDGSVVQFATLHNLTRYKELKLGVGDELLVYKANMVIPAIEANITQSNTYSLDMTCPCCGTPLEVHTSDTGTETLHCTNEDCAARHLAQFEHAVGRDYLNVKGLAGKTLEDLIGLGLWKTIGDIWVPDILEKHKDEIIQLPGWGEDSYTRLFKAIEKARKTTLDRVIAAMGIPTIGRSAGKAIRKYFKGSLSAFENALDNGFDFHVLPDFGDIMCHNLTETFRDQNFRINQWNWLTAHLEIVPDEKGESPASGNSFFAGKTLVATGTFQHFTRASINSFIESLGASAKGSVSKKTDFVVAGSAAGSKLDKAKQLGVPVISEDEFLSMAGQNQG